MTEKGNIILPIIIGLTVIGVLVGYVVSGKDIVDIINPPNNNPTKDLITISPSPSAVPALSPTSYIYPQITNVPKITPKLTPTPTPKLKVSVTNTPTPTPTITPTPTPVLKPVCSPLIILPQSTGPAPLSVKLCTGVEGSPPSTSGWTIDWDFNGDGTWDLTGDLSCQDYVYSSAGSYHVKARLKNNNGLYSDPCQQYIIVNPF